MKTYTTKDIKNILSHISKEYNIPNNSLKDEVDNLFNTKNNVNNKCIAITGNEKQCTRSKSDGVEFCKTHLEQKKNNCLRYGCIKIKNSTKNDDKSGNKNNDKNDEITNKLKKEKKKNKIRLEYLTINNIDYLYNPITKIVYDFDTKMELGKLSNDYEIIKKNKKF